MNPKFLGRKSALIAVLFSFPSWAGCGGSGSTTTPPPPPVSVQKEFLYQFSSGSATQVSTLDTTTGALSAPIEATPFVGFENQGVPAVATPDGKFIYEQAFYQSPPSVNAIWGYSINPTDGTLTSLPQMPVPQNSDGIGFTPNGMVMDPQGKFLFVSVYNGTNSFGQSQNSILTFAVDPTNGALTQTSTLSSTAQAWMSVQAVDPSSRYLYVSTVLSGGLAITIYSISPSTGALQEISGSPIVVVNPSEGVQYNLDLTLSPDGKFVYAATISNTYTPPGIYSYSVDPTTNSLTLVPGSPFQVGAPSSIRFSALGDFLFGTYPDLENISVFDVNTTSGIVNPSSTSSTSIRSFFGLTLVDPSGKFLLFNDSAGTVSTFKVDGSTGALTPVSGSPFPAGDQWATALVVRTSN